MPSKGNIYLAVMDAFSGQAVYGRQIPSGSRHGSHMLTEYLHNIVEQSTPQIIQSLKYDDPEVRSAAIDALYELVQYGT
jgi:hypothetical protein